MNWQHGDVPDRDVLVIGAAVVRHGRVLATRRTRPAEAAGRWEFPGGKVEPGEDAAAAVVREVREELGCEVVVTGMLAGTQPIRPGWSLRIALARLVDGEPTPHEHDAVRWLAPEQLDEVPWLEPDRPFLAELREVLNRKPVVRAVLYEAEQAGEVAERLRADGFDASIERERFAGEDDDEDHPWVLVSDAPEALLETLVEEYDGWLDDSSPTATTRAVQAPPLPDAPRRVKGHFRRP
jgi:8-oxo-dGTP diphosphatase